MKEKTGFPVEKINKNAYAASINKRNIISNNETKKEAILKTREAFSSEIKIMPGVEYPAD